MQEIDQERFPFITGITYASSEYYGIVVNYDNTILTMYDLAKMPDLETRTSFVTMGETWWWESNRKIPINIFLKGDWSYFRSTLVTLSTKDIQIVHGPCVRLSDIAKKRVKRRTIQLVRRPI